MNRLIDTMTEAELSSKVLELCSGSNISDWVHIDALKQALEALFAPVPHWSDNLGSQDDQSWVFCFVSDHYPEDTRQAKWIARVNCAGYRDRHNLAWKYATPIDLNVRFKEGG